VAKAVRDLLDLISPDREGFDAASNFRKQAIEAIEHRKRVRALETSDRYEQALNSGEIPDLSAAKKFLDEEIAKLPPKKSTARRALKKVRELIDGDGKPLDMNQAQGAKEEIDVMIDVPRLDKSAIGKKTKKRLVKVQKLILDAMDIAVEDFGAVRAEFAANSPPVKEAFDSIVGVVSRTDEADIDKIASMIFNPKRPRATKLAKKIISEVSPDAFSDLLREWIEGSISDLKTKINLLDPKTVTAENVAEKFHDALFGTQGKRDMIIGNADGVLKENLIFLEKALSRATLGKKLGSPTATRELNLKGIVKALRDWWVNPPLALARATSEARFNSKVKALTEVLYSPEWRPQLNKIKALRIETPKAAKAFLQLLNDVESSPEFIEDNQVQQTE
jgi:hypothetical protein